MTPRERAEALFVVRNGRVAGCHVVLVESPFAQHTPPVRFAHLADAQSYVTYVAAPIAAAIESALAEQAAGEAERAEARHRELLRDLGDARERADALMAERNAEVAEVARLGAIIDGEAERVREAVAREREACAVLCETWTDVYPGASYARGCAARIRARATSPAPEAAPAGTAVLHDSLLRHAPAPKPHPADRAAADAAKAARARGEDVYADGEGRCEPAPEPVAAERAVAEAAEVYVMARRALLDGNPPEDDMNARSRARFDAERTLCAAVDALAAARKGGG